MRMLPRPIAKSRRRIRASPGARGTRTHRRPIMIRTVDPSRRRRPDRLSEDRRGLIPFPPAAAFFRFQIFSDTLVGPVVWLLAAHAIILRRIKSAAEKGRIVLSGNEKVATKRWQEPNPSRTSWFRRAKADPGTRMRPRPIAKSRRRTRASPGARGTRTHRRTAIRTHNPSRRRRLRP